MGQDRTKKQKKAMVEAMERSLGIVTTACRTVGISRQTHYQWMSEDDDYKNSIIELNEVALDFAESQLHQQIKSGNTTSTIFYLKTKGRKRGYVEGLDITSGDEKIGGTSQIEVIFKDMNKPKEGED